MFRQMRRIKQQLSESECREILAEATSGVLALCGDDGYPYALPMSYVCDGGEIYFHCANEGHKMDAVARSDKASFCVIGRDRVLPEKYATDYRSVIVFGRIRVLEGGEADAAIEKLAVRYAPDDERGRKTEIARFAGKYSMLALSVEHMTGKKARLSSSGG